MISLSHAPNATPEQQALCRRLLRPWNLRHWRKGSDVQALESWFKGQYNASDAIGFSTGREALYAIVRALGIGHGDEVIVQAYTCIVVPHAVIWNGAQPVYIDIDASLNLDPNAIAAAITPKTKAVIVQHTFGMPADMQKIVDLCKARGLLLIEDVAHAFGAKYQGQPVGSFGDAALFSFGRDKAISSTAGGMAIAKDTDVAARLRALADASPYPNVITIKQNLLHPLIVPWCAKRMGKRRWPGLVLRIAQALRLINRVYSATEIDSKPPKQPLHRLPNAMAMLAWQQLQHHHKTFLQHRKTLAQFYTQWAATHEVRMQALTPNAEPSWLRFTLFVAHPQAVITAARKHGYLLGDWYKSVIMPTPHDFHALGYTQGSCPKAEAAAQTSLNLPTHSQMSQQDLVGLSAALSTHV